MAGTPVADAVNALVRFCARRDVDELTAESLGGPVDVAILFGGSILAGADVLADVIRGGLASFALIVGGQGHSTDALRRTVRERTGWRDVDDLSEAALFDRCLRERHGLAADALEERSTNCGSNVVNALGLLRERGVRHDRILLVQDATMQQRMDAGFRRHVPPTTGLVSFASHRTLLTEDDDGLRPVSTPLGMWETDRYVSMLMGEIPRLVDDRNGYGPAGRGYIAHVDVPREVVAAFDALRSDHGLAARVADERWADGVD